jgi:protein-disulfide isomerase
MTTEIHASTAAAAAKPSLLSSTFGRLAIGLAPAVAALGIAIGGGFLQFPAAQADGKFSATDKAAIEKIVRDYLISNPEVLFEAKEAYDKKQEALQMAAMKTSIGANSKALFKNAADPVAGDKNGDVTVVEFFDYNCGYCRQAMNDVTTLLNSDKKVRLVLKEFPIFGENSVAVSKIALAAQKQGKYWELHQALYERKGQDRATPALALEIAKDLGLDVEKLKKDADSAEVLAELTANGKLAEKMGIQGTPHFIVGDNVIAGAPRSPEDLKLLVTTVRTNGCSVC